jgi:hypothetical protein
VAVAGYNGRKAAACAPFAAAGGSKLRRDERLQAIVQLQNRS